MTTEAAEKQYLANHLATVHGRPTAVYNPANKPLNELPKIYGFNNGGSSGWYHAVLLAEDGNCLGEHICSHECYMPHDLGILKGSRSDRHADFQKHYPDGYVMEFVSSNDVETHDGLQRAFKLNDKLREATEEVKP
jgi:hypothetical protein